MTKYDERELFSGLAAHHWAAISDTDPRLDQTYYRDLIASQGGRALELACGAGRLLLAYLREGFDVVGTDISADILEACRRNAAKDGLTPTLYEQPMQELDVPGKFRTIYIPCGSFVCVMDRHEALETLKRCKAHLEPGGVLAFNVFPSDYDYSREELPEYPEPWAFKAEKDLGEGRRLIVSSREIDMDPIEQIWLEERRYELYQGDELLQTEVRGGQGRWYFRNELLWMLEMAGFTDVEVTKDFTAIPFGPQYERTMVFTAR